MKKQRFKVAPRCSVITPSGDTTLSPGQTFEVGDYGFSPKQLEGHVRSGYLLPIGALEDRNFEPSEIAPGTFVPPAISAKEDDGKDNKVSVQTETVQKDRGKVEQRTSLWDVDPNDIDGLDLDQLNVMILERDPDQLPFKSFKKAKAHLTKDFKGGEDELKVVDPSKESHPDSQVASAA